MQIWPLFRLWGCPSRKDGLWRSLLKGSVSSCSSDDPSSWTLSLLACWWLTPGNWKTSTKSSLCYQEPSSAPQSFLPPWMFTAQSLVDDYLLVIVWGFKLIGQKKVKVNDNAQIGSVEIVVVGFKIDRIWYIAIYIWACQVNPIYCDIF